LEVGDDVAMRKDIQNLFDEFMYECEFARKLRPKTMRGYRDTFELLVRLTPGLALEDISTPTITNFFKILQERKRIVGKGVIKCGVKKSTIATYWKNLNGFFEWLKLNSYIDRNPFASLSFPTPVYEERKFLKKEEVEKILTAILRHANNTLILKRDLVIFYTLLYCGLRKEELISLQIRDIDLQRRMLTVRAETSKTPRTRFIPLHSQLVLHIKDYLRERGQYTSPYLFVSSTRDERLGTDGIAHLVRRVVRLTGIRFHAHQFRHTFAVNFLKGSNNVVKLQQLLGHRCISMTMAYVRCLPTNEMREDVEHMSIDRLI
jgi:integrase